MSPIDEAALSLARIPDLQVTRNEPLAAHARFELGGPAAVFASAARETAFVEALRVLRLSPVPWIVIGAGTNLVIADAGFPGVVLRCGGGELVAEGSRVSAGAGVPLQELVDFAIRRGLAGLENMTGIPGQVGAAIYGNAGAYGSSIADFVREVRFFDGTQVRTLDAASCEFRYRSSIFKQRKDWLILSATLEFPAMADAADLRKRAAEILEIRNAKYPPEMRCAGSIFKNLFLAELPAAAQAAVPKEIVKGGKVPAAWFLEVTGVKGMRSGGIRVADYHANLVHNAGGGTARELREVVQELKRRVRDRFGIELEEEIQYVGFDRRLPGLETLETTVAILNSLLAGATDDEMNARPAPDRWPIAEVLAHLVHVEQHCFAPRLRAMIEQDDPELEPYDPEVYDRAGAFRGIPPADSLRALAGLRRGTVELLSTVPAAAEARTARHRQLGRITLGEHLNEMAFHDIGHIRQVAELLRAVRYYPRMGPFAPLYRVKP